MGEAAESSSNTRRAARWSLHGMTALVTGGTRGIGHAVVEELAGLGAAVYTCSRKEAELAECLKKWEGLGFRVSGSVCDLSVSDQREELLRKAAKAFDGKLNILINNVGTNIRKPTIEYTGEEFSFLWATNFESAFHMCQLAHPLLKASGIGNIIFISSVSGVVAIPSGAIYGATKGAMNQLAKNLACEWAKDNIRVNSVAPWYIKTSLVENVLKKLRDCPGLHHYSSPVCYPVSTTSAIIFLSTGVVRVKRKRTHPASFENDTPSQQMSFSQGQGSSGYDCISYPSWKIRRSRGGVISGIISLPSCCFLHNRADHFC